MTLQKKTKQEDRSKPKHPGGRPTKFDPEYHCPRIIELGKERYAEAEVAMDFGIAEATLHNWKNTFPEFLEAFNIYRTNLKASLFGSIKSGDSSQFYQGRYMLSVCLGVRETQEIKQDINATVKTVADFADR